MVDERTSFSFDDLDAFNWEAFVGKLRKAKLAAERALIAQAVKRTQ